MNLPIALFGYVRGPLRWEGQNDLDLYESRTSGFILNEKPFVFDRGEVAVTHLQKESKFGFLVMWPFIFHVWYTVKFQDAAVDGTWVPGTEKVLYLRSPGWRFDFADWKYIISKGYAGLRWD